LFFQKDAGHRTLTCLKLSTCWRRGWRGVPRVVVGRLNSGRCGHPTPTPLTGQGL
jgi:hypothetical protein